MTLETEITSFRDQYGNELKKLVNHSATGPMPFNGMNLH